MRARRYATAYKVIDKWPEDLWSGLGQDFALLSGFLDYKAEFYSDAIDELKALAEDARTCVARRPSPLLSGPRVLREREVHEGGRRARAVHRGPALRGSAVVAGVCRSRRQRGRRPRGCARAITSAARRSQAAEASSPVIPCATMPRPKRRPPRSPAAVTKTARAAKAKGAPPRASHPKTAPRGVIVGVGLATVDLLCVSPRLDERLIELSVFSMQGGGSTANTMATLAVLGAKTRFFGRVGDDHFGRFVLSGLEELGVDTSLACKERDKVSPVSIVEIDEFSRRRKILFTSGSGTPLSPVTFRPVSSTTRPCCASMGSSPRSRQRSPRRRGRRALRWSSMPATWLAAWASSSPSRTS